MISKILFLTFIGIIFVSASSEDISRDAREKCNHIHEDIPNAICHLEYFGWIDKNGKFNQTRALEVMEIVKPDDHDPKKDAFKICIYKLDETTKESIITSYEACMRVESRKAFRARGIPVWPEPEPGARS